jgi:hypothetical protein
MLDKEQLRFELLKITHAHGRSGEEAIGRAREYETYILEERTKAEALANKKSEASEGTKNSSDPRQQGKHQKGKSGNLDSLL